MTKNLNTIISDLTQLKYFEKQLTEQEIIDVLSDIKHRIFPRPFERLSAVSQRSNLIGVEIGVAGGEHALSMLENLNIKKLYLVDPYDLYDTYTEGKEIYGISQSTLKESEKSAREKLKKYERQIVWIKKQSNKAILDINDNLDFVYIDGNHAYDFVLEDLRKYYSLIRPGGVLGGHDYYNGFTKSHSGVIAAVQEFASTANLDLTVEMPDFWFDLV
jgi:predicted O-methyltransferase YrrM